MVTSQPRSFEEMPQKQRYGPYGLLLSGQSDVQTRAQIDWASNQMTLAIIEG
jgi:hypothetical protein